MAGKHSDYEHTDADLKLIAVLAAAVGTFLIAAPLVLLILYPRAHSSNETVTVQQLPPKPRLQVSPGDDLATLHADEENALSSYGWIDKAAGIVRIPVERAMALIAQRGIAGWDQNAPAPQIPPRAPQR